MKTRRRDSGVRAVLAASPSHKPAFTLIEVMVVVAIIALLVAILLPSLAGARNQAQAAVCANNLKQISTGVLLHTLEKGMRREWVSTNYGWATYSFRQNSEVPDIFTCPSDKNPWPIPAVFTDIYANSFSVFHGRVAGCGVFNEPGRARGKWLLDIQDTVDQSGFGGDAGTTDDDLLLSFQAQKGERHAMVKVDRVDAGWDFRVFNHKGQLVWDNAKSAGGERSLPLMWMSYGANAPAGLKNTKGIPLLIVENSKTGIFPESYKGYGGRPEDKLKVSLRFRHDGALSREGFSDPKDPAYKATQSMNGAFLDGHVERLRHHQMIGQGDQLSGGQLRWFRNLWLGNRRGTEFKFD